MAKIGHVPAEVREELKAQGYTVEDMGAVHGEEFAGQYRWLKNENGPDETFEFQDWGTSDTADEAWGWAYRNSQGL